MRIVNIEKLPKKKCKEKYNINWKESIGLNVSFIYDEIKGNVQIIDYNQQYLYLKYLNNDIFKITTTHFLNCNLGGLLGIKTNEFKFEINNNLKDKNRNLTIIDKVILNKNNKNIKYYKYHCNKCNYEGLISQGKLLDNGGCICCSGQKIEKGINDVATTDPWMIPFFQGGIEEAQLYTHGSNKTIYPICPDCGRIKTKPMTIHTIYRTHSIGCICGDGISYPEKFMFNLLNQINIDFIYQLNKKHFNWIKNYKYDFYFKLYGQEYIIETDGSWHYNDNKMTNNTKEDTNKIDDYKDKLANDHNIEIIRINCEYSEEEYIKDNILNSKLNKIFDLSNINWDECNEFGLSNKIKQTCELKKNNQDLTSFQIGKIMKLSTNTIISYLKKGQKLGWCDYNPKEEITKAFIRGSSKPIGIFKDDIMIGKYNSIKEMQEDILKKSNIKLDRRNITAVCNGKKDKYKGFVFKFI